MKQGAHAAAAAHFHSFWGCAFTTLSAIVPTHQSFTRTSRFLHQSCAGGFTRRAVILKESRGQHPHSPSRASHVYQVTLHLHPFPNARTWRGHPRKNTVGRAATSGVRSNRGIGLSQPLAPPPVDCLMRIHHPVQTGSPPRRATLPPAHCRQTKTPLVRAGHCVETSWLRCRHHRD